MGDEAFSILNDMTTLHTEIADVQLREFFEIYSSPIPTEEDGPEMSSNFLVEFHGLNIFESIEEGGKPNNCIRHLILSKR